MFPVTHHDHGRLLLLADAVFFQDIADHIVLIHTRFIHGRAADKFKILCQLEIFQDFLCGLLRLRCCHIEFEASLL